jgi:hypothetical protein
MNAVVTDRALLPFWRSVAHLVRFDLRRARLLAVLMVGLEIARAAFAEWTLHFAPVAIAARAFGAFGAEAVEFFDPILVVATALTTAVIVQADLPTDDRAFWRTRPIAPLALAVSKLMVFALLFVAVPAVINAARLTAYGAPPSAAAAASFQILIDAGATVSLSWALALATRTLPRFIAAAAAALVGGFLALGAVVYWMAGGGQGVGTVGFGLEGSQTDGSLVNAAFTVLAFAILVVHYRMRRWRVAVTAGIVLVAASMLVPANRTAPAASPDLVRLVEGRLSLPATIEVPPSWQQQSGAGWPVFMMGRIEMPPLPADVSAAVSLQETQVIVDGRRISVRGTGQCCGGRGPIGVVAPSAAAAASRPGADGVAFGLPAQLVPEVTGRRIAVEAVADVTFARHRLAGEIPLRPGAAFRTPRYLLEVVGLEHRPAFMLIRFVRFPRFGSGGTEGLSLFVADPSYADLITTTSDWRIAPSNAASGVHEWARGRTWAGRSHILLSGVEAPRADARLLIVETWPAGVVHTTLSAPDVEVRAPRIK